MRLIAIDPSSRCTGYATFADGPEVVDAGRLKPAGDLSPLDRIDQIVSDVESLIDEEAPTRIVIEITAGKSARRLGGRVQGLGVYGMAVGAIRQACRAAIGPENVFSVPENVWTAGVPKGKRLRRLRVRFPRYKPEQDPGGDVGDAIGLGLWWLDRHGGQNGE